MGALKSLGAQGPAPKAPNALARARRRSVRGGASCVPAPDPRSPAPVPALPVPGAPPPQGPAARRAQRRQRAAGARSRERGARRCGARAWARAGRSRLGQLKRCRGGGRGRAELRMAQPRPLEPPGRPRRGSLPSGAGWQVRTRAKAAWPRGSAGDGSAQLLRSPAGSAPVRAGVRGSVMEGVLASGLTHGHRGHRAHPCPGVPGLELFLQLPTEQSARGCTVALGCGGTLCVCGCVCACVWMCVCGR